MFFKSYIISILSLSTASHAAVSFYGSKGKAGDYVSCASKNLTDTQLASLFSLIYPSEAMHNSTSFHFDTVLICGDDASRSVAFNCNDLGAKSACINGRRNATSNAVQGSLVTKRANGFQCDKYTGQCRNEYQSTSGWCSSGYKAEGFEVNGYTTDIWCSKPCSEEENQSCRNVQCATSRDKCEGKFSSLQSCTEALVECRGTPVKMKDSQCKTEYIGNGLFDAYCDSEGLECVHYKDGACTLDMAAWDNHGKWILKSVGAKAYPFYE